MTFTIRAARGDDLASINEIYNYFVDESTCTYQETPEPMGLRQDWFARHGPSHPVTVADAAGRIVGWGALSPFHVRSAYRFTVENSVYVSHEYHRKGIGDAILSDLVARARALGHRTIVAGIDAAQLASAALHAKHGFVPAGRLRDVGYKFERWLDVVYMQLILTNSSRE